jgi:hypothetical protein
MGADNGLGVSDRSSYLRILDELPPLKLLPNMQESNNLALTKVFNMATPILEWAIEASYSGEMCSPS